MNATPLIPPELMAELQEAAEKAAQGERDPEAMRQACARMDHMREQLRQRQAELNVAVELIREVRDD